MKMKKVFDKIPWPFRSMIFNFLKWLTIKMSISLPKAGLKANNFGSFMVTNVGSIGIDNGLPALFPISNVSFVFSMGSSQKKPVVINDEIVIRKMMYIGSTVDHRIVDAMHGGKLFRYIKRMVRNPELLEEKPVVSS